MYFWEKVHFSVFDIIASKFFYLLYFILFFSGACAAFSHFVLSYNFPATREINNPMTFTAQLIGQNNLWSHKQRCWIHVPG